MNVLLRVDVFTMPDDFDEGEYFKITVEASHDNKDRDQSLPFDIVRRATETSPETAAALESVAVVSSFESYASGEAYETDLRAFLIQKGPGTPLMLRKSILNIDAKTPAMFVRSLLRYRTVTGADALRQVSLHDGGSGQRALVNVKETEIIVSLRDLALPEPAPVAVPAPPRVVEESSAQKVGPVYLLLGRICFDLRGCLLSRVC